MFPILRNAKWWVAGKKQAGSDVLTLQKGCHSLMLGHDWNRERMFVIFGPVFLSWDTNRALKISHKNLFQIIRKVDMCGQSCNFVQIKEGLKLSSFERGLFVSQQPV